MRTRTALVLTAAAAAGTAAAVRGRTHPEGSMEAALQDEGSGYPFFIHRFDGFAALHTASFAAVRGLLPTDLLHPVRAPNGRALLLVALYRKYAASAGLGDATVQLPPYAEVPVIAVVSRRPMSLVASTLAQLRFDPQLGGFPIQFPMTSRLWRDMARREAGMPVFVADVAVDLSDRQAWHVRVSEGDRPIIEVAVSPGGVLRESGISQTLFGVLDGELLGTRMDTRLVGRMRLGGASLSLGRDHPVSIALRTLDIAPRAIATSFFANGGLVAHRPSRIGSAGTLAVHPGIDGRDGVWTVRCPGTGLIEETGQAGTPLETTGLPASTGTRRRPSGPPARTPGSASTSP